MSQPTLAFIGAGNMAGSLIRGLVTDGHDPARIVAADPNEAQLDALARRTGVRTTADNGAALDGAGVVVLAVKPQVLQAVARGIAPQVQASRPLVISVAAGIREAALQEWLGGGVALVRTMPNTPAMIGAGATVLHAAPEVSGDQRDLAESILRAVGLTRWVDDEALLDAVTALSGSGPAYFFLVMEAMEQAAVDLGLPVDTARLLTLQTALGTARMAIESDEEPANLRRRVTSPGGTTERAIAVFERGGLHRLFAEALTAARDRSVELSDLLGKS
ncbi:MAG: pyrroline-5-carboxylate reductase [Gammaproteobacteria bacterium]|jgi:pyrroline-5-carboxylate reductase|nr:pyrroline-5-carboxylate reductase [Gammaproteobacteria bacterium]